MAGNFTNFWVGETLGLLAFIFIKVKFTN